ncbi:MAG TPA: hypothetical protein VGD58_20945 [Herpetosiphonaceae bacterium]
MGAALTAVIDHTLTAAEIHQLIDHFLAGGDGPIHTAIQLLHSVIQPHRNLLEADGTWRREDIPLAEKPWHLDSDESLPLDLEAIWTEEWWAPKLEGPMQIGILIWRHTCEVNFWNLRWDGFLTLQTVQDTIRLVCYELMQACHGSRVLYLPDSNYDIAAAASMPADRDGTRIEEIEAWLQEFHGPPQNSLGEIAQSPLLEGRAGAYFIDTFSGVRLCPA